MKDRRDTTLEAKLYRERAAKFSTAAQKIHALRTDSRLQDEKVRVFLQETMLACAAQARGWARRADVLERDEQL